MPHRPGRRALLAVAGASCLAAPALAQPVIAQAEGWPARPVRIVVPFTPGGSNDAIARPLAERLQEQERTAIVAAIDTAQGNIAHAARALGINRSTLYYRMRKHGLEHLLPMKDAPASSSSSEGA